MQTTSKDQSIQHVNKCKRPRKTKAHNTDCLKKKVNQSQKKINQQQIPRKNCHHTQNILCVCNIFQRNTKLNTVETQEGKNNKRNESKQE